MGRRKKASRLVVAGNALWLAVFGASIAPAGIRPRSTALLSAHAGCPGTSKRFRQESAAKAAHRNFGLMAGRAGHNNRSAVFQNAAHSWTAHVVMRDDDRLETRRRSVRSAPRCGESAREMTVELPGG